MHKGGVYQGKVLISNRPWSKHVPLDPSWTPMHFKKVLKLVFSETPPSTQTPRYSLWERPGIENLNFVFAIVKIHSQEPKRNYYKIWTNIGFYLQTSWVCYVSNGCFWSNMPRGFTLHMTGYAPACTKSVEKGSFLDIRRRRRLLQKGYIFRC